MKRFACLLLTVLMVVTLLPVRTLAEEITVTDTEIELHQEPQMELSEATNASGDETTNDIVASGECGAEGNNVTWTLDNQGLLTICGKGAMKNYSIDSLDTCSPWNEQRDSIKSVSIHAGVTTVGSYAFFRCENLSDVTVPDGVTSIGSSAFDVCSSLTSITLPNSVISVGGYAFGNCTSLTRIILSDSLTTIGIGAFDSCIALPEIDIPNSVTNILSSAFRSCRSLTSIVIPEEMTRIEENLFEYCKSLKSVVLPVSIKSIGRAAFDSCPKLEDVFYCGSKDQWNGIAIAWYNDYLTRSNIHYNSTGPGFSAQKDGWSFVNDNQGFDYPENYRIPEERYKEVFGSSYVAAAKLAGGKTLESMMNTWTGNCYGMSTSAILFYQKRLDWSYYNSLYINNFNTVNSYYNSIRWQNLFTKSAYACSDIDSEITNLIERYQILQLGSRCNWFPYFSESLADFVTQNENTYTHNSNGTKIDSILQTVQNSEKPLLLSMYSRFGGHTVVARTDKRPVRASNGWYQVYIYDPNTPYMSCEDYRQFSDNLQGYYLNLRSDDRYIELNPDNNHNQWRYVSSDGHYWGSDKSGKIITRNPDNPVPESITIYSLPSDCPVSFNGSEPWKESHPDAARLLTTSSSTFTAHSSNGNEICRVVKGQLVSGFENVEYYPSMGYTEDSDSQAVGGQLVIPTSQFTVQYESGDDISIIGSDSVINVAADGEVVLDVAMDESTVKVSGDTETNIAVQITDVYSNSDYTSAEINGTLVSGDEFSIQLNEDTLTINSNLTGSEFYVYTDNVEQPDAVQLGQVSSENSDIHVEDVRNAAASVEKITITPEKLRLTIDETGELTAHVSDDVFIEWTSADPHIASVDKSGVVTGLSYGTTTITATIDGGYSATCQVTVAPLIKGDVNRDGTVNARDMQRLYECLTVDTNKNLLTDKNFLGVADTNGDGAIDVYDLQRLYEHVSKIKEF